MEIHIIFGPTAASKTKIAQSLWEQHRYPILSVDSRKVYKGADIGTNKLSMLKFSKEHPEVIIGGIDFLEPTEEINAFIYQQFVYEWIESNKVILEKAGGLIIHGGTGLYLDAILEGKSMNSPRNAELRSEIAEFSTEQLQTRAIQDNSAAFEKLNPSDRMNPRRLLRVIENTEIVEEIADSRANFFKQANVVWHITIPERQELYEIINARVFTYFSQGWLDEVDSLLKKFENTAPALKMMGYKQLVQFMEQYPNWKQYVDDNMPQFTTVIDEIQREHRRYAKRQETWAKKYLRES